MEFAAPAVGAFHRAADVEHDMEIHVRLSVELFYIQPSLAGIQLPVHMPQIISLDVLAMRVEFDAESDKWALVQAVQESFHDRPGAKFNVVEPREERRIDVFVRVEGGKGHGWQSNREPHRAGPGDIPH